MSKRGLGIGSVWMKGIQDRQVVAVEATRVQWANLASSKCEKHWTSMDKWLDWVRKAKRIYD